MVKSESANVRICGCRNRDKDEVKIMVKDRIKNRVRKWLN